MLFAVILTKVLARQSRCCYPRCLITAVASTSCAAQRTCRKPINRPVGVCVTARQLAAMREASSSEANNGRLPDDGVLHPHRAAFAMMRRDLAEQPEASVSTMTLPAGCGDRRGIQTSAAAVRRIHMTVTQRSVRQPAASGQPVGGCARYIHSCHW